MYYKVFINNVEVVISKTPIQGYKFISAPENLDDFYRHIESEDSLKICIANNDGAFWKMFTAGHKLIEAAGGLVLNSSQELLVIKRLGHWDLPKGKMEKGESIEETALREVMEECGIENLKLGNALPDTFHTYKLKEERILKRTYWFFIRSEGEQDLIPQTEEGISEVKFMNESEVKNEALKNTYESLKPLFNAYLFRYK